MNVKRGLLCTAAALAVSFIPGAAVLRAAPILPGNLVVTQVGDGVAALSSGATPVNVLELTTAGAVVQTIAMPTVASGANNPYTASGTQIEQHITLSGDGQYVTLGGYNAAVGTATIASSAAERIMARIPLATGTPDTSTSVTDFGTSSSNNNRSVISPDGVQFFAGTATGTRYVASNGATTSTLLNNANARNLNIVGGQLYVSSGSTPIRGVSEIGSGVPTTSSQTLTRLPGMSDAVSANTWDFFFANDHTVYLVDDGTSATTGGLQKWVLSDDTGSWSQVYRIATDGTVNFGMRGLAGYVDGGNAVLFGITNQTTSRVVTMTDPIANTTAAAGQVWTGIYTAPTATQVRGVEFIPVPEPGSVTVLLLGAGSLLVVRRRRGE